MSRNCSRIFSYTKINAIKSVDSVVIDFLDSTARGIIETNKILIKYVILITWLSISMISLVNQGDSLQLQRCRFYWYSIFFPCVSSISLSFHISPHIYYILSFYRRFPPSKLCLLSQHRQTLSLLNSAIFPLTRIYYYRAIISLAHRFLSFYAISIKKTSCETIRAV